MADVGPSQSRGRHSGLSRTGQGQTITPLSSEGESYGSQGSVQSDSSGAAQRRGLDSALTPTGQGQAEVPVSGRGESYSRAASLKSNNDNPSYSASTVLVSHEGGGGGSVSYYLMRGWRPLHVPAPDYETWVAVGNPNTSNPSGEPIQDIVIQSVWTL